MAHEVQKMAFVGTTPWHGLGNRLTEAQPIEVWVREAGFDFDVKEAPVHFLPGAGDLSQFDGQKVLYRSDSLSALSVVTNRYKVVQPRQVLEFYRNLVDDHGYQLETAGCLRGGRKIWALAKTGVESTLRGNDRMRAYLLLCTSYDGSLATTAQYTAIRVVCNNTLSLAVSRDMESAVRVPHCTEFDPNAVKLRLGLGSSWEVFMDQIRGMSEASITPGKAKEYLTKVLGDPSLPQDQQPREKLLANVFELFSGKAIGSELPSARGTVFGLLNAVTETVDHHARARSVDSRLNSAWFGLGAAVKKRAFQEALKLAA